MFNNIVLLLFVGGNPAASAVKFVDWVDQIATSAIGNVAHVEFKKVPASAANPIVKSQQKGLYHHYSMVEHDQVKNTLTSHHIWRNSCFTANVWGGRLFSIFGQRGLCHIESETGGPFE